jgi:hypothetical protein
MVDPESIPHKTDLVVISICCHVIRKTILSYHDKKHYNVITFIFNLRSVVKQER